MEVQGKIIAALPEVNGIAKSTGNPWKKRDYVLETHDQIPRKIAFDLFGDKVDQYPLQIGDEITLSFDIESREYQGRWYTNIRGWKVDKVGAQAPAQQMPPVSDPFGPAPAAAPAAQYAPPAVQAATPVAPNNPDDLPF